MLAVTCKAEFTVEELTDIPPPLIPTELPSTNRLPVSATSRVLPRTAKEGKTSVNLGGGGDFTSKPFGRKPLPEAVVTETSLSSIGAEGLIVIVAVI
jgi:hypothetical protein